MKQVKETAVGFLVGLVIYTVVVEIVGIFFSDDMLSYSLGLVLGAGMAVILFAHMAKTLDYALDLPEQQASSYVKKQSFFRLFLMLVVLVIGRVLPAFNFITVVLGLLGLKIASLFAPVILRRLYPDSYITKEEDMVEIVDTDSE